MVSPEKTNEDMVAMAAGEMPKKTKMVAGKKKSYRIKMMRDAQVTLTDGTVRIAQYGEVLDVTKECAIELLGTKIDGYYTHSGESTSNQKEAIYRAIPFKEEIKPQVEKSPEMDLDSLYESL